MVNLRALLCRMAFNIAGLYLVTWLVKGDVKVGAVWSAALVVLVYGLLSAFMRPLIFALRLITAGANIVTLGLLSALLPLLVNALLFFVIGMSNFIPGFEARSFYGAFVATVVLSIVNFISNMWLRGKGEE